MRLKNTRSTRKTRATKYGNTLRPVSDERTDYGHARYRKPVTKNEFSGVAGTKPEAVILDIDGTLQDWGAGLSAKVAEWCAEHYKKGRVFIVITARTHDWDYERSFNWLMRHFPYPFIGPFCRVGDDPRYACEFKREVAEGLSHMFTIVGAADDNRYVNDMWKHWAALHPEVAFDHLECGYTPYTSWRSDLDDKGTKSSTYSYSGKYGSSYAPGAAWEDGYGWGSYDRWEGRTAGDDDAPLVSSADSRRIMLEDEVLACYPKLTQTEVENMDDQVLNQLMLDMADQPETAPLDVAEIFEELGEKPYGAPVLTMSIPEAVADLTATYLEDSAVIAQIAVEKLGDQAEEVA